jgi:hypothetical protein
MNDVIADAVADGPWRCATATETAMTSFMGQEHLTTTSGKKSGVALRIRPPG